MITSIHGQIRTTEEDDAPFFCSLYVPEAPRFALLDTRREPLFPTLLEVRETLGSKEAARSQSYTMEAPDGAVLGFMVLRGLNQESGYCELTPLMLDEASIDAGTAAWALEFILERAFAVMRLRKVTAHALSRETHLCTFLLAHGFTCDGAQREVLFSRGQWLDVLSYSLENRALARTEIDACP